MDNNLAVAGGIPVDFSTRMDSQWAKTLESIDVYYLRRSITTKLSDFHLRNLANTLNRYNIKTAIDTPLATWGSCRNNRNYKADIDLIKRLERLGFKITHIGLQSVLSKPYKKRDGTCNNYRDINTYNGALARVFDVIEYFRQVKGYKIGIIDALPAKIHDPLNRYAYLYNELKRLNYKLDFIHLDVPVSYPRDSINNLTYLGLSFISKAIQSYNVKFGYVLASNVGGGTSGLDVTKYKVHGLHRLLETNMRADHWISSGWYPHPQRSVPESDMSTSTGALLKINDVLKMWRIR